MRQCAFLSFIEGSVCDPTNFICLNCRELEAKTRQKLTGGDVDINDVYAGKEEAKQMEEEAEKEDELDFDLSEPAPAAA